MRTEPNPRIFTEEEKSVLLRTRTDPNPIGHPDFDIEDDEIPDFTQIKPKILTKEEKTEKVKEHKKFISEAFRMQAYVHTLNGTYVQKRDLCLNKFQHIHDQHPPWFFAALDEKLDAPENKPIIDAWNSSDDLDKIMQALKDFDEHTSAEISRKYREAVQRVEAQSKSQNTKDTPTEEL